METIPSAYVAEAKKDISYVGARLREPSTYQGLGALAALLGLGIGGDLAHALAALGFAVGNVIGVALPEGLNNA